MKVLVVAGARPNFPKIAPIMREFSRVESIGCKLVHTGQHYDARMSRVFFEDLELPEPDFFLGVGSASHAEQTARVMIEFEKVVLAERPDVVLVVGDVNSTLAAALVAVKLGVRVAHVEAGLRSFDSGMPEEINRKLTDHVSDWLFTTCEDGETNLRNEGIAGSRVCPVGNVMIDTLRWCESLARGRKSPGKLGLDAKGYALVTLHRPTNVDDPRMFERILGALIQIAGHLPVVFPIHPRSRCRLAEFGLQSRLDAEPGLRLCEPLNYLDFLGLLADARLVLTDSGGIQEETTVLGVPCLTLRENTERPITITTGTNVLVGLEPTAIVENSLAAIRGEWKTGTIPPLWDGHAAGRIVDRLLRDFGLP